MALQHAKSGEPVRISPAQEEADADPSAVLIRDEHIEVFRLTLERGASMHEHRAAGAMTLQCLSGEIELNCHGRTHTLAAGELVFLRDAEPHAVTCRQSAVLLITLILHRK